MCAMDGVWTDGTIIGAPAPPSSSSAASPGNVTLSVLVFGPESVSYERSRRVQHAKMREIPARVFFAKILESWDLILYIYRQYKSFSG